MKVANALPALSVEADKWLTRPVERRYWALIIDGTYFNIRRRGSVEKEPSLVVLGIDEKNHKTILAIEPGHRDNVDSWRAVFRSLKARGLDGAAVCIGVMDGLLGLEKLFLEEFPNSLTARCWVHVLRNALGKCPARLSDAFKLLDAKVMYAKGKDNVLQAFQDLKTAMGKDAAASVACLEKNIPSLISHHAFDKSLWNALKTTNSVEQIRLKILVAKSFYKSCIVIRVGIIQTDLQNFESMRSRDSCRKTKLTHLFPKSTKLV